MSWHAVLHGGPHDGEEMETDTTAISVLDEVEERARPRHGYYYVDKRLPMRRVSEGTTVAFYWAGWDDGKA